MNKSTYLIKNSIILLIGSLGTKLVSFALVPLYTNLLTPSEYGLIDIINILSILLTPIFCLNVQEGIMRFYLDKNKHENQIRMSFLMMVILDLLLSIITFFIFQNISDYANVSLVVAFYFFTASLVPSITGFAKGNEQIKRFIFLSIGQVAISSVLTILFLKVFDMHIFGYILGLIIGNIFTIILGVAICRFFRGFRFEKPDSIFLRSFFKYCLALVPYSILIWIVSSSDKIMLKTMCGADYAGLYSVAYKIPSIIIILVSVFTQAWTLTSIVQISEKDDYDRYNNLLGNSIFSLAVITISAIVVLIRPFYRIYVGVDYYGSWIYVPIFLIIVFLSSFGSVMSVTFMKIKKPKHIIIPSLICAIVNILLNFILIPRLQIFGALISAIAGYFLSFIYKYIIINKITKFRIFSLKNIISLFLIAIGIGFVYFDNIIVSYIVPSVCLAILISLQFKNVVAIFLVFKRSVFSMFKKQDKSISNNNS